MRQEVVTTNDLARAERDECRARKRRQHARAFADTCLGLFWLGCLVFVAVLVWKLWGIVP